jgi:RimJ/RimL family protein N-acetyltransferase
MSLLPPSTITPATEPVRLPLALQKYETSVTFQDGLLIHFRPIQPQDKARLQELFDSHSEQTIRQRYLATVRYLSPQQIEKFVVLDYRNDFALIGLVPHEGRERMICVGRYFRDPTGPNAEVAITVHDDFHHQEIGTFLARTLVTIALEHGIIAFTASVLVENQAMMHIFRKVATRMETSLESGVYQIRFEIGPKRD